jgi:hypothetical protein
MGRIGRPNKRKGSHCDRKNKSAKKARKDEIIKMRENRHQSNLKYRKVMRQQHKEHY